MTLAGDLSAAERRCEVLARLWPRYQRGLTTYLRHKYRIDPDQAADFLQDFVLDKVLLANLFGQADRSRGHFRSFLLRAVENHFHSQHRRATATKRQPDRGWVSVEELRESEHPDGVPSPSAQLDWCWAEAVLEEAAVQMRAECAEAGRMDIWKIFNGRGLEAILRGRRPVSYVVLARRSGVRCLKKTRLLFHSGKRMFRRAVETVLSGMFPEEAQRQAEFDELVAILFGR